MNAVLSSYCVCRRPSWKPKTQPNGSSGVVWWSFLFSTRFTWKKLGLSCFGRCNRLMKNLSCYQKGFLDALAASSWMHWQPLHPGSIILDALAASASRMMLPVHPGSTDGDLIGYSSVNCICRRPSWTPKTQPNGAVRRRLVEFLVFNSVY